MLPVHELKQSVLSPRLMEPRGDRTGTKRERRMVEASGRILVAQRRDSNSASLAALLRGSAYKVTEAFAVEELSRRAADLPDLIVLESSFTELPATEVLHRLREDSVTSAVPVLFLDTEGGGEASDWDGYLVGDADPLEILAWVRALVRRLDAPRMESLGRIASGVVHDLNNLLTVLLGHAELLEMMLPAGSSGRGLLSGIETAALKASEMASQLLALASQKPVLPELMDLNRAVLDLVRLLQRVFDSGIQFNVETTPIPEILAVPCQVTQVLLNLCLNARDAMPHGGSLTLRTEQVSFDSVSYVRLEVADTGGGIPEELLPRVFDPFFTTRPGKGTGLGLAMVQQIVRLHKGWVECKSELGRGSRFEVYLPLRAAVEAA